MTEPMAAVAIVLGCGVGDGMGLARVPTGIYFLVNNDGDRELGLSFGGSIASWGVDNQGS